MNAVSPIVRPFLSILLGIILSLEVSAAPITIGPYTFAGEEAFPTDTDYRSGDQTYIVHPDGGSWYMSTDPKYTLDAALTGHDVTLGIGGRGIIVDLIFGAASIINGPGADLVVFETVFVENFDIAAFVGDTLTSPPDRYWSTVLSGVTVGSVAGINNSSALNAAEIDLSDLGILDGQVISKLRLYSQPFDKPPEDATAGADIVVVGALNLDPADVPEPSTFILLGFGVVGIGFSMRKRSLIGVSQ